MRRRARAVEEPEQRRQRVRMHMEKLRIGLAHAERGDLEPEPARREIARDAPALPPTGDRELRTVDEVAVEILCRGAPQRLTALAFRARRVDDERFRQAETPYQRCFIWGRRAKERAQRRRRAMRLGRLELVANGAGANLGEIGALARAVGKLINLGGQIDIEPRHGYPYRGLCAYVNLYAHHTHHSSAGGSQSSTGTKRLL